MNILRLAHSRCTGCWKCNGRTTHTMCYYQFRKFFRLPASAKTMDLVISKKDPEYAGAYKMRVIVLRRAFPVHAIEWYNDKQDRWERCPLTSRSVDYLTREISRHWRRAEGTYYVWVEHD